MMLIRADADFRMGSGHVMRCLALAQAWQDGGGRAGLASVGLPPGLTARWTAEGFHVEMLAGGRGPGKDAEQTIALARRLGADWVVADGYQFSADFQRAIKQAGLCLLVLDDSGHAKHYWADLVLNQNLHAEERLYRRREPYTRLLLGTRFALLRREFGKWRGWKREVPEVGRKVLVTLGGSDPDNVTVQVIRAIQQVRMDGLEAIIVAGAGNPHQAELEAEVARCAGAVRLRSSVTDMPELMAWADVAIAAGGATSWERSFMGLPSLVIILADNQQKIAERTKQAGIGRNLGRNQLLSASAVAEALEELLEDKETRAEMALRGPEVVDGLGAARVIREIRDADVWLRPACAEDCRLTWEWANEPVVRAASFTTEAIPWERHQEWFAARLREPTCAFFIAVNRAGVPIGQVRCEVKARVAILSISLDPHFRGNGFGPKMIRKGSQEMFARGQVDRIDAFIRPENQASHRAFEKAGFKKVEETVVWGHPASRLVLEKSSP
jgi:UDP-2,4-diacetamido-2,4,6-trideoxy-beta-L-altropyranose hydrolase